MSGLERIELGDEVKDRVTGYQGIAIGRTRWLTGCDRITVQATLGSDGKPIEAQGFDEPMLDVVAKGKVTVPPRETRARETEPDPPGGPRRWWRDRTRGDEPDDHVSRAGVRAADPPGPSHVPMALVHGTEGSPRSRVEDVDGPSRATAGSCSDRGARGGEARDDRRGGDGRMTNTIILTKSDVRIAMLSRLRPSAGPEEIFQIDVLTRASTLHEWNQRTLRLLPDELAQIRALRPESLDARSEAERAVLGAEQR